MTTAVADIAAAEAIAAVAASDNASPFDPSRYKVEHDVAVLDEHQPGPDSEGNPRPYIGYDELKAVVDEANERIADTGDYVAINIGHTLDDPNAKPQPAVGFAGPFRLQKIGVKRPRWAIVADQWAINKKYEKETEGFPRRSVELWFSKRTGRPVMMDPISLLGATTPERALGLKLSAKTSRGDLVCERYEMGNAAANKTNKPDESKSPGNNDPRNNDSRNDSRNDTSNKNTFEAGGQIEPLVAKVIEALEATDVFQYVRDLQKRHAAEIAASLEEGSGELGEKDDPIPGQEADDNEENGDMSVTTTDKDKAAKANEQDGDPAGGGGGGGGGNPSAKDKAEKENYAKAAQERDEYRDKYQKEKREREELAEQVKGMNARLLAIESEKKEVERYNKLRDLVDKGYILDLDEERKIVSPSEMSDAECDRYMKSIERNGRRAPIGHVLDDNLEVEKFQKSGDKDRDAKRQQVLALAESKGISYEAACKEVGYTPSA